MNIAELLDMDDLLHAESEGYVRRQHHPDQPLDILNYTERAQFEKIWTPTTLKCRGLIYNTDTGEIVARPFEKFFNYGEHPEGTLDLNAPAIVTNKMDGSLGIIYLGTDDRLAVATRGSFTSDQALHATQVLRENGYETDLRENGELEVTTHLVEIVYPQNRIVLDYGIADDLFYLGAVNIETGVTYPPETGSDCWIGPTTHTFAAATLGEAFDLLGRPNAEGVVVHFPNTDVRVKIKQDDYVQLHRLITGMNARVIWEHLGEGKKLTELMEGVPEEFWPWIAHVGNELIGKQQEVVNAATTEFEWITSGLGDDFSRKDFAQEAVKSVYKAYLFQLLDKRDISGSVWKTLKPSAERAMTNYTEDVA